MARHARPVRGVDGARRALQGAVRKTIKAHLREVAACFETEPPPPDQRVVITFTVAASGKVIESVGTGNPPVDDCAAAAIKKIKFPASNSVTRVVYPFWIDATR